MSTLKTNNIQHVDRSEPSIIINTDGGVSIAGTLTYEDVTSVDAVGIVTARGLSIFGNTTGLNVASGISTFQAVTGTTGTFSAAVSGTTGAFTDDVTVTGDKLKVFNAGAPQLRINSDTGDGASTRLTIGRATASNNFVNGSAAGDSAITFPSNLVFGVGTAEKVRIDSSGRLLLGTTTEGNSGADDLTIATTGNTGITIRSGTSNYGNIYFSDGTSGSDETRGYVSYEHSTNSLQFATDATEALRITSGQLVGIGTVSPGGLFHTHTSSGTNRNFIEASASHAFLRLKAGSTSHNSGLEFYSSSSNIANITGLGGGGLGFEVGGSESLRIDTSGRLLVNNTSSTSPDGFDSLIQVNAANHEGSITIGRHTANANGPALLFQKSRSGTATPGTGVVSSGDVLGTIRFYASDGTDRNSFAANIGCEVDGSPGGNDMPGRLIFSTTADSAASSTERMRITKDGYVSFGLGSSYAPESPIDVVANWANTRSNVAISNSYDRKLPLDEHGDITITTRHSPSKDSAVGYVGPVIDFRSTNSSNEEWTVAQIVGGTDALGGTSYQGGLSIFASNGGNSVNSFSGRRDQGDAPTLSAVFAPFRITTFTTTSAQGNMALHITKNHAANNVQSDMIAFDVGGGGRGKIVSASSGSGNPSFGAYSDRRLKTNFRDYTGGYDRIKAIPVKLYDEVLNDQTKSVFNDYVRTDVIGWIADEVQSVFPEAVMGTKDQVATADDVTAGISTAIGDPIYQSLTEGTFLPDAIQAIQKLIEKVETLETKVAALEG